MLSFMIIDINKNKIIFHFDELIKSFQLINRFSKDKNKLILLPFLILFAMKEKIQKFPFFCINI